MIKIGLNIELDYQVYAEFRNFSVSGVDFGLRIKKDHPHINLENYKKYIDEFYKENNKGYVSIFDCNPRFVDDKSFQVFYKKSGSDKLRVCFHEITHFAFFDYFEKLFPAEYRSLDRNSGVLWELSEVINVILLNE